MKTIDHHYSLLSKHNGCACKGKLVFYFEDPLSPLQEDNILSEEELRLFKGFPSDKKQKSFLSGRFVAKSALSLHIKTEKSINHFTLLNGESCFPFFKGINVSISLSHSNKVSVATVLPSRYHIGLDIEKKSNFSLDEHTIIPSPKVLCSHITRRDHLRYSWIAMESLSKVLRIGFTVPLEIFSVSNIAFQSTSYAICEYTNFRNFQCLVLDLGNYLFGICYFASNILEIDIETLNEKFLALDETI